MELSLKYSPNMLHSSAYYAFYYAGLFDADLLKTFYYDVLYLIYC